MKLIVDLKITPRAGQSQQDAESEFTDIFAAYLTDRDAPFMSDYGSGAWGGYEGPFVDTVAVTDS